MSGEIFDIYVRLLGEAVPVWAPFPACKITDATAKILSCQNGISTDDDKPEYMPGEVVRFERKLIEDTICLAAAERRNRQSRRES